MQEIINKYCAEKIINDIREGKLFDDQHALAFNSNPLIIELRNSVMSSDLNILLNIVNNSSLTMGNLAIDMLRNFDTNENIKQFLLESWNKEQRFLRKFKILWRLIDDENLPLEMHSEIYEFIVKNFMEFLYWVEVFYNGKDKLLKTMKSRLSDTSFPKSKKWVRLCSVVGSSDKNGAKELISQFISSEDEFLSKVANDMLELLNNKKIV